MQVPIKKLSSEAKIPTYATLGAGGFDFYSTEAAQLTYGSPVILGTGVAMKIPEGHSLLIFSRSGHGFKENIRLSNSVGLIDSDYTGEIKVKLTMDFPSYTNTFNVAIGDRIAQGMVVASPQVKFLEVEELPVTQRGSDGFGSTGVK